MVAKTPRLGVRPGPRGEGAKLAFVLAKNAVWPTCSYRWWALSYRALKGGGCGGCGSPYVSAVLLSFCGDAIQIAGKLGRLVFVQRCQG